MIVARLTGGLGNQMFQYAAARGIADRRGCELLLDLTWYASQSLREYELRSFAGLRARVLEPLEVGESYAGADAKFVPIRMWGLWETEHLVLPGFHVVLERGPDFEPAVLDAPPRSYLVGYWQSEKYFLDLSSRIREDFSFEGDGLHRNTELEELMRHHVPISVHVRRADYVTNPKIRATVGTLTPEYYAKAGRIVASVAGETGCFLVFSDDPEWCRRELELPGPAVFVEHDPGDAAGNLRLLSLCRHHVIANSSFSWWGAWLSQHPDKLVLAPRRWARDPRYDSRDVVPGAWVRL